MSCAAAGDARVSPRPAVPAVWLAARETSCQRPRRRDRFLDLEEDERAGSRARSPAARPGLAGLAFAAFDCFALACRELACRELAGCALAGCALARGAVAGCAVAEGAVACRPRPLPASLAAAWRPAGAGLSPAVTCASACVPAGSSRGGDTSLARIAESTDIFMPTPILRSVPSRASVPPPQPCRRRAAAVPAVPAVPTGTAVAAGAGLRVLLSSVRHRGTLGSRALEDHRAPGGGIPGHGG
jgi:hypothetical protein